jgi:hypothetical protein
MKWWSLDYSKSAVYFRVDQKCLEVVSKPQIAFKSKASLDEKAEHIR